MIDSPSEAHALLPAGLAAAIEAETGAILTAVKPRGGGGASREGAELWLAWPDGRLQHAYMNYDVHKAGAGDDAAFLREAAVIRALAGPLISAGVRVAPFIAAIPQMRALIGGFVGGEADFNKLKAPEARMAVARDFMEQLARLHSIDVVKNPIEGMGPLGSVESEIRRRLSALRASNEGRNWDPLIHLSLDWLAANIPRGEIRPVLVHGDAGPANFLYAEGKVTILLDWELTHYGDPMADLAMLCLRLLFQPFAPLPEALEAYREAGGAAVDLARLRYWRLLFQTTFARRSRYDDPDAPPPPNLGMNMVYSTVHRRVLSEALAEAAGVALETVTMPEAPEGRRHRSFETALNDLRDTIVRRVSDQQAAAKAKGLARLIKWWRDCERYEPAFDAVEREEISAALGRHFPDHSTAWTAYCDWVRDGAGGREVDGDTAIRLINAHVTRESRLMADAQGGLAHVSFAPLE